MSDAIYTMLKVLAIATIVIDAARWVLIDGYILTAAWPVLTFLVLIDLHQTWTRVNDAIREMVRHDLANRKKGESDERS